MYVTVISTRNNERKPSVAHPTTSATFAVPTDCSKQAVHHLNATEHCLDPTHDEQQGEEGQVPGDDVFGRLAHVPQCVVSEVIPGEGNKTGMKTTTLARRGGVCRSGQAVAVAIRLRFCRLQYRQRGFPLPPWCCVSRTPFRFSF